MTSGQLVSNFQIRVQLKMLSRQMHVVRAPTNEYIPSIIINEEFLFLENSYIGQRLHMLQCIWVMKSGFYYKVND